MSALSEGWTLSGITRLTTGMPVTLYNNDDTSLIGSMPNGINNNGVDTPNYRGGDLRLNMNPRNGSAAFDASRFAMPALGQIGNARRRFFYGPGWRTSTWRLRRRSGWASRGSCCCGSSRSTCSIMRSSSGRRR